jgi:hypothetical protein
MYLRLLITTLLHLLMSRLYLYQKRFLTTTTTCRIVVICPFSCHVGFPKVQYILFQYQHRKVFVVTMNGFLLAPCSFATASRWCCLLSMILSLVKRTRQHLRTILLFLHHSFETIMTQTVLAQFEIGTHPQRCFTGYLFELLFSLW